mmetsp:Transcript_11281/g.31347  ORF Transcript_11281/g.31347 Transcript_11281/m.31347 type:complete len:479 (-) Transcript_11281:2-1438(-)
MGALELPFVDGQNHEWLGCSLKTSPISNLSITADARRIAARPFPGSLGRERRHRETISREGVSDRPSREPVNHNCQWPHVRLAQARGLVPRGTLFESYVHDAVEPRRSGMYEFCVVGVDISEPGRPRYHAWEPTGHQDRSFACDEVDHRLSMKRFGRSVSLQVRPRHSTDLAHLKQGPGLGSAVRWPEYASTEGLVHGHLLPSVDDRGRPVLPSGNRFPPRNSEDLLAPMVLTWKTRFAGAARSLRFLAIDTGRFASSVQDEFPDAVVEAVDDSPRMTGSMLKTFRDRYFPINEKQLDRAQPALHYTDKAFDVVILPFVFHRVCDANERRFLGLLREALRVASEFVLFAEDVVFPETDEAAIRRWKSFLVGELSSSVLLDGELRGGPVPDHHLSASGVPDCSQRRFFVIESSSRKKEPVLPSPVARDPPRKSNLPWPWTSSPLPALPLSQRDVRPSLTEKREPMWTRSRLHIDACAEN